MNLRFAILWLLVGIPLALGVGMTLRNAMKLFQ
jgi:predicted signal transduction protein with EAL and GGDEF domain